MDELHWRSANELARMLRRREVGAEELLRHLLGRVERHNPALGAVCVLDAERALVRAREADRALARGELWGPLHGLPMTVKESFDLPGLPTTWGFEALRGNVPERAAAMPQRLIDAGAVIFGKTNVPVALADWQSFNPVYGTTNNPWDLGRTPGGSSGGSAAALAAGLTALELGSDIGASIRNPAHYCGVWGHKPTWGMLSMAGQALPGTGCADTLDIGVVGPLARSAFDLGLAMDIMASPLQALGALGWQPVRWRDAGVAPRRMRVAVLRDDPVAEVDASVQRVIAELADFLRREGVAVTEDVRPVDSREAQRSYVGLLRAATGAKLDDAAYADALARAAKSSADSEAYGDVVWRASTMSHREWVQHDQVRQRLRGQWRAFFESFDLLVCPVATTPAFPHNQQGWRWERLVPVNGRGQPSTDALFWAGYPGSPGLPATAVPIGESPEGLPIGAQIVGPWLADPACLRFAQWLETAWRGYRAPPGWD